MQVIVIVLLGNCKRLVLVFANKPGLGILTAVVMALTEKLGGAVREDASYIKYPTEESVEVFVSRKSAVCNYEVASYK